MPGKRLKYSVPKMKVTTYYSRRQRPSTTSMLLPRNLLVAGGISNSISDVTDGVYSSGCDQASAVIENEDLSPIAEDSYYRRKQKEVGDWESIRNDLFVAEVTRNIPCGSTCTQCGQVVDTPIRCSDCGPFVILCNLCEVKQHVEKHLLHKPEIWEVIIVSCSYPLPECHS
jgi:hypothetical protein